jgi:hypothetical protein
MPVCRRRLQPVSVQAQQGLNLAAGFAAFHLRSAI